MDFGKELRLVRQQAPLVQCITNFVTVNDCANIVLAAGGSPSMADDLREAAEAVRGAAALVCNLGAIAAVDAMLAAGKAANDLGKPVVLDPVAAGNTALRRKESSRLLAGVKFAAIRGNASEIRALARGELTGSGVDVSGEDAVSDATLPRTVETARLLAKQTGAVVAVSGPIDVVTDGEQAILLRNGCATMARITGSGCMLTSMLGAFCGADSEHPFDATCAAIAAMGVAGDLAEERRLRNGTGNATFRTDLIDAIFNLTEEQLNGRVRYEVYEG